MVATIYLLGYIDVRYNHLLIHSSSFTSDRNGIKRTEAHHIFPGDAIGLLQPRLLYKIFFARLIYKPLTMIEERYWYIVEPKGGSWPYTLNMKPSG